jgi:heterotetrameric sarcosine oxidase delta subunit
VLIIPCPHCGPRPVEEYRFGGELPEPPESITDEHERDLDRVWFFTNVEGVQTERWFHAGGCHRWATYQRDTSTDTVV